MTAKTVFNPKFWSLGPGHVGNNSLFLPCSQSRFAASNLSFKANKIYYCFYSQMTESSHSWDEINLREVALIWATALQPWDSCFISSQIKNLINFITFCFHFEEGLEEKMPWKFGISEQTQIWKMLIYDYKNPLEAWLVTTARLNVSKNNLLDSSQYWVVTDGLTHHIQDWGLSQLFKLNKKEKYV